MSKQIAVGGWIPRTKINLQEFYDFINGDDLIFGSAAAKRCRKALGLRDIEYHKRDIDFIRAKHENMVLVYTEDGLAYIRGPDKAKAVRYFDTQLMPSLGFLYSKGAPVPHLLHNLSERKHVIRTINPDISIMREGQQELPNYHLFEYVVFFDEFNSILKASLNMHRAIWDSISQIRDKEQIRFRDLPKVRDELLDMKRKINFMASRIKQMEGFMNVRLEVAPHDILEDLKKMKEFNFATLQNMRRYYEELYGMTEKHVDTTLNMVQILYQENEQHELTTLQMVFIIGTVAAILSLGAMPGAVLQLTDTTGQVVMTGKISSFNYHDLIVLAPITLVIGIIIYYLLHFFYKSARRFKIMNFTEGFKKIRNDTIDDLKKYFS